MTQALNRRIAQALGIELGGVVGFELRCWAGEVPSLRVTKWLLDADQIPQLTETPFELVLKDPPPPSFDLDAMCAAALERLAAAVDQAADRAKAQLVRRTGRGPVVCTQTWRGN